MDFAEARAVVRRLYDQFAAVSLLHEALAVAAEAESVKGRLLAEQNQLQEDIRRLNAEKTEMQSQMAAAVEQHEKQRAEKLKNVDDEMQRKWDGFHTEFARTAKLAHEDLQAQRVMLEALESKVRSLTREEARLKGVVTKLNETIAELRQRVAAV